MTPLLIAAAVVVAWLVAVILILCFMAGATWDDDDDYLVEASGSATVRVASWDDDDYRAPDDGFDSVVEAQIREALAVAAQARMDGAAKVKACRVRVIGEVTS